VSFPCAFEEGDWADVKGYCVATAVLLFKTQIGLGVLSVPSVLGTLGIVPGTSCRGRFARCSPESRNHLLARTWCYHDVGRYVHTVTA
jgi:hypothetical protein